MPVPTYDRFIDPVLRYLARHPEGAPARDAHDASAATLGLSESDREERLPSGVQAVYKNRAGWAHDRLKRAGLSQSPRRGFWRLTQSGIDFALSHSEPLSDEEIWEIAAGNHEVRLRPLSDSETPPLTTVASPIVAATASPDDRLEAAVAELRSTTTTELLETLANVSPKFFETIVLDVLHKMGYGANRGDLQRVGGSGDGGIDGVISLDRLGLEKVYVQAMIDYEVGVTMRPIRVPKLDTDYFDEQ